MSDIPDIWIRPDPDDDHGTIRILEIDVTEPTTGSAAAAAIPRGSPLAALLIGPSRLAVASEGWVSGGRVHVEGRLTDAGSLGQAVSLAPTDGAGLSAETGEVTIANADGAVDALADLVMAAGLTAHLSTAQRRGGRPRHDFTGIVTAIDVGLETATLTVSGPGALLDAEAYPSTYAGTGGPEGPAEIADVPKPKVIGRAFNAPATLIEPTVFVYQIHDGPITRLDTVRIDGVPYRTIIEVGSFNAMATYRFRTDGSQDEAVVVWRGGGMFRPYLTQGGATGLSVTADIDAGHDPDLPVLIALVLAEIEEATGVRHDAASVGAAVAAFDGYAAGMVVPPGTTWAGILDRLTQSLGVYWGTDRTGRIALGWLPEAPEEQPETATLTEADILAIDRIALPDGFNLPHRRRTVRFGRNWTPAAQLTGIGVDPAVRSEWRSVTIDGWQSGFTLDPDPFDSLLADRAGAAALAARMVRQHGVPRRMITLTVPSVIGGPGLLEVARIEHPRFDLASGRRMAVVAREDDFEERTVNLTLWG